MPHYYIDMKGHFGTSEDLIGVELPNILAARKEAMKIAAALLEAWGGLVPRHCDEIIIEVKNEELCPVLTIPYAEFACPITTGHAGA